MTDAIKGVVVEGPSLIYMGGDSIADLRLDTFGQIVEYDGKEYVYPLRIIRAGVDDHSIILLTLEGAKNLRQALAIMIARLEAQKTLEAFE